MRPASVGVESLGIIKISGRIPPPNFNESLVIVKNSHPICSGCAVVVISHRILSAYEPNHVWWQFGDDRFWMTEGCFLPGRHVCMHLVEANISYQVLAGKAQGDYSAWRKKARPNTRKQAIMLLKLEQSSYHWSRGLLKTTRRCICGHDHHHPIIFWTDPSSHILGIVQVLGILAFGETRQDKVRL